GRLHEDEGIARRDERNEAEQCVPVLVAHGEGTRIGNDCHRAAAEHHRGRDPAMDLADQARGIVPRAAEIPSLERLAVAGERPGEGGDRPGGRQGVVTEEVGEGTGHPPDGIPQANGEVAGARTVGLAGATCAKATAAIGTVATRRAPLVDTSISPAGSIETWIEPSVSVRRTRAPVSFRRSIVDFAGWPYGLPAPDETIATLGWTAPRNAGVDAVALPWWATFRMSTAGSPRSARSGSTSSSTSPVSRKRRPATSPSRTIDTSLIPRPASGGSRVPCPGSGQSTVIRMSSMPSRAPVESVPIDGAPAAARSRANAA